MFVAKVRTITRPGTLMFPFLKAIIHKRGKLNGCKSEDEHSATKQRRK